MRLTRIRTRLLTISIVGLVQLACSGNTPTNSPAAPAATATPTAGKNTGPPIGWIDAVNGAPKVGGTLQLGGWAADPDDGAPVQKIEVTLDGKVVALAGPLNLARPDVAAIHHRDNWLNSGWGAEVRLTGIFPGKHKLAAVAYDSAGTKAELQGAREIDVSAGQ